MLPSAQCAVKVPGRAGSERTCRTESLLARNACTPICGDAGSCSPLEPQLLVVSKSKKGACERAKCMYTCQRTVRASRSNPRCTRERWCIHAQIAFTCNGHIPFHTRRNACTQVNVHVFTREHIAFRARSHRACGCSNARAFADARSISVVSATAYMRCVRCVAWGRRSCRPRSCRQGCQEFVLSRKSKR